MIPFLMQRRKEWGETGKGRPWSLTEKVYRVHSGLILGKPATVTDPEQAFSTLCGWLVCR